jgi:hypothetical protein
MYFGSPGEGTQYFELACLLLSTVQRCHAVAGDIARGTLEQSIRQVLGPSKVHRMWGSLDMAQRDKTLCGRLLFTMNGLALFLVAASHALRIGCGRIGHPDELRGWRAVCIGTFIKRVLGLLGEWDDIFGYTRIVSKAMSPQGFRVIVCHKHKTFAKHSCALNASYCQLYNDWTKLAMLAFLLSGQDLVGLGRLLSPPWVSSKVVIVCHVDWFII